MEKVTWPWQAFLAADDLKAGPQPQRETPRDCVVVFQMPEPLIGKTPTHLQTGEWYRTSAMSFPEASKRVCHYLRVTRAVVCVINSHVLDRFPEAPIPQDLADKMYENATPRLSIVLRLMSNVCLA